MKMNPKKKKIIIIIAIAIIILGLLGWIGYEIVKKSNNNESQPETPKDDLEYISLSDITTSEDEGRDLQMETKALNATYPDVKGWLKVPGTSIDTAIYQSTDNERYLRHDKDNNYYMWGEEFLDYRCNIDKINEKNIHYIIYGHNSSDDSCFTPLLKYKDESFFKDHKVIEFSTLNGNYKWEIFSVYVTDTTFFYIDTNFEDDQEYIDFLNTLKSKSSYDTGVSVSGDDTILTLSTCEYSTTGGRFVVQAKLVK